MHHKTFLSTVAANKMLNKCLKLLMTILLSNIRYYSDWCCSKIQKKETEFIPAHSIKTVTPK